MRARLVVLGENQGSDRINGMGGDGVLRGGSAGDCERVRPR
jgi:hypothetical protein